MPDPLWTLRGFRRRTQEWVGREHPPPEVEDRVAQWLPTLAVDPYHGAFPEEGGGGEVYAVTVPDVVVGGYHVVCSYRIELDRFTVRCEHIEFRDDPPGRGH